MLSTKDIEHQLVMPQFTFFIATACWVLSPPAHYEGVEQCEECGGDPADQQPGLQRSPGWTWPASTANMDWRDGHQAYRYSGLPAQYLTYTIRNIQYTIYNITFQFQSTRSTRACIRTRSWAWWREPSPSWLTTLASPLSRYLLFYSVRYNNTRESCQDQLWYFSDINHSLRYPLFSFLAAPTVPGDHWPGADSQGGSERGR